MFGAPRVYLGAPKIVNYREILVDIMREHKVLSEIVKQLEDETNQARQKDRVTFEDQVHQPER